MPQFFVDQLFEVGSETDIVGSDAHHILHVLRLKVGDWLVLSDGKGRSFHAEIVSVASKTVRLAITKEIERHAVAPPPTLAFAIIKHDRSEWIIEKAVELGCTKIIPFSCLRTIPKYEAAEKKLKRWQDIAVEAAKQSGLPFKPCVDAPISFGKLCDTINKYEKTLLFWEDEQHNDLKSEVSNSESRVAGHGSRFLIIIGPEGGFDLGEIESAKSHGAVTVSLGQQILRVETAAITALAVVQYELGNLSI